MSDDIYDVVKNFDSLDVLRNMTVNGNSYINGMTSCRHMLPFGGATGKIYTFGSTTLGPLKGLHANGGVVCRSGRFLTNQKIVTFKTGDTAIAVITSLIDATTPIMSGQTVSGSGIDVGTTVVSYTNNVVTISKPTISDQYLSPIIFDGHQKSAKNVFSADWVVMVGKDFESKILGALTDSYWLRFWIDDVCIARVACRNWKAGGMVPISLTSHMIGGG